MTNSSHKTGMLLLMPLTLLVLVAVMACTRGDAVGIPPHIEAELTRLDSVIDSHPAAIARKRKEILNLRRQLTGAANDSQRNELVNRLIREYYSFDLDSAGMYAEKKRQYAVAIGDREMADVATLTLARMKFSRGHEFEALQMLREVLPDTVMPGVKIVYYDFMTYVTRLNGENSLPWHQKLDTMLPRGTSAWVFNHVNMLKYAGRPAEALKVLRDCADTLEYTDHDQAISQYLASELYLELGDTTEALGAVTRSAILDLSIPVRDYMSLYELSALLLARGDIQRSYRYINLAADDGQASKVLGHIQEVNELLPMITHAYGQEILRETRIQRIYVGGISLLAAILIVALFYLWRSRNAASDAARLQTEAVALQTELNSRLTDNIRRQRDLNEQVTESNRVKDAYIMQYVNLCSYFLGRFDDFRESVATTAKTKGLPGIERLLAHADDDRELKKFYANFDSTFLKLFPDFVAKFNALLQPDSRVELRPDGTMTNELRTFSLIRLGITDSEQIAVFLRRSVSTVYNYRVKMRNAALGPRDKFEEEVARIS